MTRISVRGSDLRSLSGKHVCNETWNNEEISETIGLVIREVTLRLRLASNHWIVNTILQSLALREICAK